MADNNDDDDDAELYDEFGNYIGPELDDSSDDDSDSDSSDDDNDNANNNDETSIVSGIDAHDDTNAMVLADEGITTMGITAAPVNAIVLHEDKEHYPSAEDTYGEGVRTAVLDEDAMELETPIVQPIKIKSHHVTRPDDGREGEDEEEEGDQTNNNDQQILSFNYTDEFLTSHLLSNESTSTRRGIAIVGHLHHGKTTLIDTLLEPTIQKKNNNSNSWYWDPIQSSSEDYATDFTKMNHNNNNNKNNNNGGTLHYTDLWQSERERQMSLVSCPMTMAVSDTRGKSYALTVVDCPGHVQFHDESVAAMRLMDGVVLCIDVVEGIMMHTEMLIQQIINDGLPVCLCLTKLDRLIVELKLPPRDAYFKLLAIVEGVNKCFRELSNGRYPIILNPTTGNVIFSSAIHGYLFTIPSMTEVYVEQHQLKGGPSTHFSKKLWGDYWYCTTTKQFHTNPSKCIERSDQEYRSFITFVLDPIYKLYAACLGESSKDVATQYFKPLGVHLTKDQLRSSGRPLLRMALSKFFETASCGFVDMIVQHIPSPLVAAKGKVARCYSGPLDTSFVQDMVQCRSTAQAKKLIMHVTKLYGASDGRSFDALARIYSGTCAPGQRVRVLGEGYAPDDDDEDMAVATIASISIPRGRSKTPVTIATAGNWVLLSGVDATIAKTATIVGTNSILLNKKKDGEGDNGNDNGNGGEGEGEEEDTDLVHIFSPLSFPLAGGEATMKMALEPLNPAELPKMIQGLRGVSKAYPMVHTRVEESGEHVLFGTGELYLDCVLHDLRHVYGDVEIKVADPSVALRETVMDTSSLKCFAETTNKKNKLTFLAEPMEEGLAEQIEGGKVKLQSWDKRKVGRYFQSQYGWDLLSSRSVWAFGDAPTCGPNLLLDDTLPSEVDSTLLNSCRSSIVQGFQWATREGPLCEEPVRATKIKILEVSLADKAIYRGGGQLIPTTRRTVHSSLLTATPRLMEPMYRIHIQCPGELVSTIQPVLKRRRGHIIHDRPISGTLLYNVRGFIPVLDSFGFETDLRTYTQGRAMVHAVFDHWAVVPGDPLDKNILLHPLEPSPPHVLARELLLKTRRRKGLSEDVSIDKFFDSAMKEYLAATERDYEESQRKKTPPSSDPAVAKLIQEMEVGEMLDAAVGGAAAKPPTQDHD